MTVTPPAGVNIVVSFALNGASSNVSVTDYTLPTGNTVVIPPGASQSNLWVRVNGDQVREYNETISLDLSGFVNATYASPYTTLYGLIVDDDPIPTLSVVDAAFVEGNGFSSKFRLYFRTYGTVGVTYSYTIELRDTGQFGFLLPAKEIVPTGEEAFAGVQYIAQYLINL